MANLNRVMLIGRLTRDPESRTFANGGKVVNFGFAVNNSRKDQNTGEWINDPVFLDCAAYGGEKSKTADLIEEHCRKGQQIFIEGRLKLDQWETGGEKRQKLKIIVGNIQFLEPKENGNGGSGGGRQQQRGGRQPGEERPRDEEYDIPF